MDVRRANRNRIYRAVYRNRGISRPELVHSLGISIPTVIQNIKSLLADGLVKEDGILESTGGRKAAALSCVTDARLAVGVEITANHIGTVVVNMDGTVLKAGRIRIPFAPDRGYARIMGELVENTMADARVDPARILGAGIALPGILSADGSLFSTDVFPAKNYRTSVLGDVLSMPCVYLNDANAAGIAEMWGGEPGGNFVYLSLSNSVGGAIIVDGKVNVGDNQRAGEFGHISLDANGRACYCGQKGCLYAYCNATRLSNLTGGELAEFFRLLDTGDAQALEIWDEYLARLAAAVNILRVAFDCEVVVGGYVGAHMEKYAADLLARAARLNSFEKNGDYVKICRRRTEASAAGAALVHIGKFIAGI
jgi:predicted NBD/HSP70 family sugar kinase